LKLLPKPWFTISIKVSCANKKIVLIYRCSNESGLNSIIKH